MCRFPQLKIQQKFIRKREDLLYGSVDLRCREENQIADYERLTDPLNGDRKIICVVIKLIPQFMKKRKSKILTC